MNFNNINTVYLLGIGGIGMSALARYFKMLGKNVAGYDLTQTELTNNLVSEGISVHYQDNIDLIGNEFLNQKTLFIYTPAIPKSNKEFNYLISNNYKLYKRSEILGHIANSTFTIAIAGTHGKTTISSMVAHLLIDSGVEINAFIGGISKNYNSNIILSPNAKVTVVEADEYDRSFLNLKPNIAIISAVDSDHLDIYKDSEGVYQAFKSFSNLISNKGYLIKNKGVNILFENNNINQITYSAKQDADFTTRIIEQNNTGTRFIINNNSTEVLSCKLQIDGLHNVENMTAACIAVLKFGVKEEQIEKAVSTYLGVKRRFDHLIKTEDFIYIDDYAHHPEEINALVSAVKSKYKNKTVCGIFQPHLFSRTRDFADEFALSLEKLDEVILLEIYPARELPIKGVDSNWLLNKINNTNKRVLSKNECLDYLKSQKSDILLTIGAGDIDKLIPEIIKIKQVNA